MPHFPTHNPLKKELNLENIYQKLPIGIELYDKEGNLIDTTNEINIREKLHAAEQEQRPALTADQRYSRFLKNRSQHIRHSSEEVRLQIPDQCNQIHIQWRNQTGLPIERK